MVLGLGFSVGTQIIIGRRNGEGNYREIGSLITTSIYFLLPLALLIFLLVKWLAAPFMASLVASDQIYAASMAFIHVRIYGIFFAFLNFVFIAFFTGITSTKVLTYATFIQAAVNVVFDYAFIFGKFGFSPMGIEGAALASVISEIAALAFFLFYLFRAVDRKKYLLFYDWKFVWQKLRRMAKVAFPIMLQNMMALSSWFAFFMIIEQIGEKELAVSHIIRSIYMVLMIPLFGFSSATSTLVSNLIGEGGADRVLDLLKKIIGLSLLCTAAFIPLLLLLPETILRIYTDQTELIRHSLPVLKVIQGSMLFFSVAYISFSAVTGTGKTNYSMAIEFSSIFIYLIGAMLIGLYYNFPLPIVWCSEFIYFTVMGSLSLLYMYYGNWKNARI